MISRTITASAVALSLTIIPATKVTADAGDFVAGAIIGGIVGHAATKQHQRKRATTTRTYTKKAQKPRIPSTQEGRNIQASLNYFGFNAGGVDGQLGRQSRAAISNYQAYLGYPATGQLSPFEQNLLVTSYNRAQAGGYAVNQQIAQNPEGTRGLLKVYRQELAGGPVTAPGATIVVAPQAVAPVGTTTTTTVVATTPTAPAAAPAAPETTTAAAALPNFLGNGGGQSLASHCNTVSLLTNSNGGFTTAASMTDPNVALNEQFCLARTYAIAKSEDMIAKVQGFTSDQIAAQCKQFGLSLIHI